MNLFFCTYGISEPSTRILCSHVASGFWVLAKHNDWNKQIHDFEISTLEAPSRIISDEDPECLVPSTRSPYTHSASGSWVLAKHSDWNNTFNDFEISKLKAPSRIISDQDSECLVPSTLTKCTCCKQARRRRPEICSRQPLQITVNSLSKVIETPNVQVE